MLIPSANIGPRASDHPITEQRAVALESVRKSIAAQAAIRICAETLDHHMGAIATYPDPKIVKRSGRAPRDRATAGARAEAARSGRRSACARSSKMRPIARASYFARAARQVSSASASVTDRKSVV